MTLENIPFLSLTQPTATALRLAVKEAIADQTGDKVSVDMVSATLSPGAMFGSETSVFVKVKLPNGPLVASVQQQLVSKIDLQAAVASWASWAQGVPALATGTISVKNIVFGPLPQPAEHELKMPTMKLAEAGAYHEAVPKDGHNILANWAFLGIALIVCCGCLATMFARKRRRADVKLFQDIAVFSEMQPLSARPGSGAEQGTYTALTCGDIEFVQRDIDTCNIPESDVRNFRREMSRSDEESFLHGL